MNRQSDDIWRLTERYTEAPTSETRVKLTRIGWNCVWHEHKIYQWMSRLHNRVTNEYTTLLNYNVLCKHKLEFEKTSYYGNYTYQLQFTKPCTSKFDDVITTAAPCHGCRWKTVNICGRIRGRSLLWVWGSARQWVPQSKVIIVLRLSLYSSQQYLLN